MKEPRDRASDTTPFLPWWDDAAQRRTFDLIRRLIEILVPFTSSTSTDLLREPTDEVLGTHTAPPKARGPPSRP